MLNFDGGGWEEIHEAIQNGLEIPDILIELKHASDVLAAIQRGDEDAMNAALLDMRATLLNAEKEAHRHARQKAETLARLLDRLRPLAREGFCVRKGRKKANQKLANAKDLEQYEQMRQEVARLRKENPKKSKMWVYKEAADRCEVSERTIRRHARITD